MSEGEDNTGIVFGRHDPVKRQRARQLRHEMTAAEKVLWQRLRSGRLNGLHFRRQQVIDGFIVDFYCFAAGLIVEVDGAVHSNQTDYDAERDAILSARNLRILRFANERVEQDMPGVLREIEAAARTCLSQRTDSSQVDGKGESQPAEK